MEIIYIFSIVYFIIALFTLIGILKKYKTVNNIKNKSVSIVMVARNEEKNIVDTLDSLKKLNLENLSWEIILVNDASEDNTLKIMKEFQSDFENVKIIDIEKKNKNLMGKKYGITKAVEHSSGDYIFMTDADCLVSKNWIKTGLKYFHTNVGMLIGHIEYIYKKIYKKVKNVESITGSIFTFSWAYYNNSPYCSGGNMAFKKEAFKAVNGYKNTPKMASGDDTFLLKKIRKKFNIVPLFSKETFVKTPLTDDKDKQKEQSKRKFAKNFLMNKLNLSIFVFGVLYHILLFVSLFIFYSNLDFWIIVFLKFIIEYFIFIIGAVKMSRSGYIVLYPFYLLKLIFRIIYYSFAGIIKGYRWKSEEKIH